MVPRSWSISACCAAWAASICRSRSAPAPPERTWARVAPGGLVALLDGGDRGAHEDVEEVLDVLDEPGVLEGHRGLAGQGGDERLVLRGEGDHVLVHQAHRAEHGPRVALLVDELDHPDDLA